jgi:hypothetical protein
LAQASMPAGGNQVAYAASEWGGVYKTTDGAVAACARWIPNRVMHG